MYICQYILCAEVVEEKIISDHFSSLRQWFGIFESSQPVLDQLILHKKAFAGYGPGDGCRRHRLRLHAAAAELAAGQLLGRGHDVAGGRHGSALRAGGLAAATGALAHGACDGGRGVAPSQRRRPPGERRHQICHA